MSDYSVERYSIVAGDPDRLRVRGGGRILLDVAMGPSGPLHPESADAARTRPWFFTGSSFGAQILELARSRAAK